MGTLVAMAYPTLLVANLADHTYVKCGTQGEAWGCWGGKSGGHKIAQGTGSTNRAAKIAQSDERASIKCYLVNGVCHQAANRILLPAGILVRDARGYCISETIFGPYGRVGIWPCRSPHHKYPNITGDLVKCTEEFNKARNISDKFDWQYINGALKIYEDTTRLSNRKSIAIGQAAEVHLKLFMHMAKFHLGPMLNKRLENRIMHIRQEAENDIFKAQELHERRIDKSRNHSIDMDYVKEFDRITIDLQKEMSEVMSGEEYVTLFSLEPDEHIILSDHNIISQL